MKLEKVDAYDIAVARAAGKTFAVVGKVKDLFKADLIFSGNVIGNEEKVLVILRPRIKGGEVRITEFESMSSAIAFATRLGEKLEGLK